jgi:mevalonate kinase
MLFGEYSLICNSMGLVVPFRSVSAKWDWIRQSEDSFSIKSNSHLRSFHSFLVNSKNYRDMLDLSRMKKELEEGLFFSSTIPQGYGAGSSGALVAGVYQRYATHPINEDIISLRSIMAGMEAYFHGNSSGIDPISCYLGETVLIDENSNISCVDNPLKMPNQAMKVFLVDTKLPRETTKLMQYFEAQLHHYSFFKKLRDQLIPSVNQAIQYFRKGDSSSFFQSLNSISAFEYTYFEPMVPTETRYLWQNGLQNGGYTMKLCGSGGGGYLLAFATDENSLQPITDCFEVIPLQ